MPKKFISNGELRKLLSQATHDEKLALTNILTDKIGKEPYEYEKLQQEISLFGGNGLTNLFRGSGTGYIDIVDDVAEALQIDNRPSYQNKLKFYDEIYYIEEEEDSSLARYNRAEAIKKGNDYLEEYEQKIIIKVMENAYKQMEKEKLSTESELEILMTKKQNLQQELSEHTETLYTVINKINEKKFIFFNANSPDELEILKKSKQKQEFTIEYLKEQLESLPSKIQTQKEKVQVAKGRLDNFNLNLSKTVNQYSSSSVGAITGTAGLLTLANMGGFATYTFLTSFMSTVSFGTLGFGAYTAATSFLSVIIGPVGWTGLAIWTLFTLGKPNMSKLVLLVATIGAIRQRVRFENNVI